ncbi:hypothetical protein [Desulfovibrio sp.]|uniref:hypothetical protein n=1 Tax=Desulfovibrio sp. TaxID=885 RepID=UPI0025C319F5|nr:hypothetical protein [Desulfovibrio sp.]
MEKERQKMQRIPAHFYLKNTALCQVKRPQAKAEKKIRTCVLLYGKGLLSWKKIRCKAVGWREQA